MKSYRIEPDRLIDITLPLGASTPCHPGDTPFGREARTEEGFISSRLTMSSHTGTHMDPPAHIQGERQTIDRIPPDRMILPASVLDCRGRAAIGPDLISGLDISGKALLLRTGASVGLHPDVPGMTPAAASLAVEMGVLLVGTDAISIDPPWKLDCHRILLPASIPVLENLLLDDVEEGEYLLLCFPLRIEGGDGSPIRAFLQRK